jgi:hypothetical protein
MERVDDGGQGQLASGPPIICRKPVLKKDGDGDQFFFLTASYPACI